MELCSDKTKKLTNFINGSLSVLQVANYTHTVHSKKYYSSRSKNYMKTISQECNSPEKLVY